MVHDERILAFGAVKGSKLRDGWIVSSRALYVTDPENQAHHFRVPLEMIGEVAESLDERSDMRLLTVDVRTEGEWARETGRFPADQEWLGRELRAAVEARRKSVRREPGVNE